MDLALYLCEGITPLSSLRRMQSVHENDYCESVYHSRVRGIRTLREDVRGRVSEYRAGLHSLFPQMDNLLLHPGTLKRR